MDSEGEWHVLLHTAAEIIEHEPHRKRGDRACTAVAASAEKIAQNHLIRPLEHRSLPTALPCIHWGILAAIVVCAAAVCLLTNPPGRLTAEDALAQLESSLVYEGDRVSFTLPAYEAGEWDLHIAGRAAYDDGFSRSLHYLEGEPWVPGASYTFVPDPAAVELELDAVLASPEGDTLERSIDILAKNQG